MRVLHSTTNFSQCKDRNVVPWLPLLRSSRVSGLVLSTLMGPRVKVEVHPSRLFLGCFGLGKKASQTDDVFSCFISLAGDKIHRELGHPLKMPFQIRCMAQALISPRFLKYEIMGNLHRLSIQSRNIHTDLKLELHRMRKWTSPEMVSLIYSGRLQFCVDVQVSSGLRTDYQSPAFTCNHQRHHFQ